jgi:hypothetical protein
VGDVDVVASQRAVVVDRRAHVPTVHGDTACGRAHCGAVVVRDRDREVTLGASPDGS